MLGALLQFCETVADLLVTSSLLTLLILPPRYPSHVGKKRTIKRRSLFGKISYVALGKLLDLFDKVQVWRSPCLMQDFAQRATRSFSYRGKLTVSLPVMLYTQRPGSALHHCRHLCYCRRSDTFMSKPTGVIAISEAVVLLPHGPFQGPVAKLPHLPVDGSHSHIRDEIADEPAAGG